MRISPLVSNPAEALSKAQDAVYTGLGLESPTVVGHGEACLGACECGSCETTDAPAGDNSLVSAAVDTFSADLAHEDGCACGACASAARAATTDALAPNEAAMSSSGLNLSNPLQALHWGSKMDLTNKVVNVHFVPGGTPGYMPDGAYVVDWNAYEIEQAKLALTTFSDALDLTIAYTDNINDAEFVLHLLDSTGSNVLMGGALGMMFPPDENFEGYGFFNRDGYGWSSNSGGGLEKGGYGFITLIHEFGHGFGLAHPHDTGGSSSVLPGVSNNQNPGNFDLNQGVFTTMSYYDGWPEVKGTSNSASYGWQSTPMNLDVAILQQLYGAGAHNEGPSSFPLPFGNSEGVDFQAIWDSSGVDTIVNTTGSTSTIDLRQASISQAENGAGHVSHIGTVYGGVTLPADVEIENATGGSAADAIYGNALDNVIDGSGGNDNIHHGGGSNTYIGGPGNDHVYFESSFDSYTFTAPAGVLTVVDGAETSAVDSSVENFVFDGQTYSYATVMSAVASNNAPVFTSGSTADFAENGTGVVYTAAATDSDQDNLIYSISGGADAGDFSIDSAGGQLTFVAPPDYEAFGSQANNNDYVVEIEVSDGNGGTATQTVTVSVTNVVDEGQANAAPQFTSSTTADFAENGTGVAYTAQAIDADSDPLTFSISGGADQGAFTINPTSGAVTFQNAPDFEAQASQDGDNDYQLELQVSDGNSGTATQAVTITVTDVDEGTAPTEVVHNGVTYELFTASTMTFSAAEAYARAQGGYLAVLTDASEASAVYGMVETWFQANPSASLESYAPDGGDAAYFWAGAGDFASEGNWEWSNGESFDDTFSNWGQGSTNHPGEPDDYQGQQDALGIALESWPYLSPPYIGVPGEWNDINANNELYFVVEYGDDQTLEAYGSVELRSIPWLGYEVQGSSGGPIELRDSRGGLISKSTALVQAEGDSGGGFIALEQSADRRGDALFKVHHFDGQGNAVGRPTNLGTSDTLLINWEDDFQADLNEDGTIGHTLNEIESVGNVTLSSSTTGGYSISHDGGGEIDLTDTRGRLIKQSSRFDFEHAEENTDGGYDVLSNAPRRGVDDYQVRHFDSSGQEVGRATKIGRSDARLADWEDDFEADLNADGTIGHTLNEIESVGNVTLSSSTAGGYSISHDGGGEITLTDTRGRVIKQSSRFDFEHAEENPDGGYDVLSNAPRRGVDDYQVRHFDSSGQEVGRATKIGRSDARLADWEDDFEVDLNADGTIGHTLNAIESIGNVTLSSSTTGGYSISHDGGGEINLTDTRGRVIEQSSRFDFDHAEENTDGGYDVLSNAPRRGVDDYQVRHFDSSGQEVGRATKIGRSDARLIDWEDDFEADLNADGTIGHTLNEIESIGNVTLSSSTAGGYSISDNGGGEIDLIDTRGRLVQQSSRFDFEHAEENTDGGYDVLSNAPRRGVDDYQVRHFDSSGQEVGRATKVGKSDDALALWEDTFEFDLNGDGSMGRFQLDGVDPDLV